jgi:AhpD family alkylhydroperoxidase
MEQRLDYYKVSPDATKALLALEVATGKLGLEPALLELVRLRASQINGCAFCVDLHANDMRKKGETERRIQTVPVWRESPFFTPRERAALAWTESVTQIATHRASDADYEALAAEFSEVERVNLTLAIGVINTWNRLSIAFRKPLSA